MKKILSIILCAVILLGVMPVVSFGADVFYNGMNLDWKYNVSLSEDKPVEYRAFTPEESGFYSLYSMDYTYDDPFVYVFDEAHNEIGFDDDSGFYENFAYYAYMEEGKTYKFEISAVRQHEESLFNIMITRVDGKIQDIQSGGSFTAEFDIEKDRAFFKFTPETSDYYAFYSNHKNAFTHAIIYDSEWNYLDEDADSGIGCSCYLTYYLEEGKTYYYTCINTLSLLNSSYDMYLEPCEVISQMEIVSYPDKMTYYDGFVEDTINFKGLELEFTYTDGTTARWLYNEEDFFGATVDVNLEKDDDGKYFVSIYADFVYDTFELNVIENPIESISVYSASKVECYENMTGYIYADRETYEEWFVYRYELPKDLMMQINYTDGTSVQTSYFDIYDDMYFKSSDNQRKGEPWTVGKNPVTIEYYGKQCEFYVEVLENPIDHFTVEKAPNKQYVYEITGRHAILGSYCEFWPYDVTGMVLTAHYKDGTTRTFTDEDINLEGCYIGGYRYYIEEQIAYDPGKTRVTMEYCGHEVEYDVMLLTRGDSDGDGEVTIMDATRIQKSLVGLADMTKEESKVSDVDEDKEVTVLDATKIQMFEAGIISSLY